MNGDDKKNNTNKQKSARTAEQEYGLSKQAIRDIKSTLAKYPQVTQAILYGSRAKGNFRAGSDIDLTLKGTELTLEILCKIENDLDDLLLPYKIDLSIYSKITDQAVLEHIDRVGKIF